MRIWHLLIFCFSFVFSGVEASIMRDSVGVENVNGKKVIIHRVEPNETYYSIAHRYNRNPGAIPDFYSKNVLKIGTLLKIHTDLAFEEKSTPTSTVISNSNTTTKNSLINYMVQPKETLYAIAKKFGMTLEEIKEVNNLTNDNLLIGDVIQVHHHLVSEKAPEMSSITNTKSISATSDQDANSNHSFVNQPAEDKYVELPLEKYGIRERVERGIAMWVSDDNLDGTQMLALHCTAPIGTVIKITNLMNRRNAFAKVVGKFSESESTKNVTIVITKAVANLIGALDKKFQVNLMYGVPNE